MKPTSSFTLPDWLDYLEHRHSEEIKLRLLSVKSIAHQMDLLHPNVPVITVAGTNGKGSTVTLLTAMYRAAGYRVGTYSSPHLLRFNERIQINQESISDEALCHLFCDIDNTPGSGVLSYFEVVTLAALKHFNQVAVDLVILEVGMGGRLDATNIIDSDLAIITTVDWDHQEYLGNTLDAIGYEKAGILRKNKPCIYADENPPMSVILHAKELNSQLICLNKNYQFSDSETTQAHTCSATSTNLFESPSSALRAPSPRFRGEGKDEGSHSEENFYISLDTDKTFDLPRPKLNLKAAAAAVVATECLQALLPIDERFIAKGIQSAYIAGRQQVIEGSVTTIFDVAHNPQAVALLADFIKRYQPKGKVHAVFSAYKDKNLVGLIQLMCEHVDCWYPALLEGQRAATAVQLEEAFDTNFIKLTQSCYDSPLFAYQDAVRFAVSGDLIVVYGSFLMVSAILGSDIILEKRYEV